MSPSHIEEAVAICDEPCHSAALEAQRIGMVEALCHRDSAFSKAYRPCVACLQQIPQLPIKIEPSGLSPFLSYCGMKINYLAIRRPPDDTVVTVTSWYDRVQSTSTLPVPPPTATTAGVEYATGHFVPAATASADGPDTTGEASGSGKGQANLRWIAAPIVGAVALVFLLILLWFFIRSRRRREQMREIPRGPVRWDVPMPQRSKPPPPQLQSNKSRSKGSTLRYPCNKTLSPREKPLPQYNRFPPLNNKSRSQSNKPQPSSAVGSVTRSLSKGRGGGRIAWFHIQELPGSPSRWSWYKKHESSPDTPPSRWSWHRAQDSPPESSPSRWSWYKQQEGPHADNSITRIEPIYELDDHESIVRETTLRQTVALGLGIYEEPVDVRVRNDSGDRQIYFV